MTGCIFKRPSKSGVTWAYSFFAGWNPDGKRLQVLRSGFPTKGAAKEACDEAIAEHERVNGKVTREKGRRGKRSWAFRLGDVEGSGFTSIQTAQAALADAKSEEQLTFARYFATWIQDHARRDCSPKTVERYRELGAYLNRHIGSTPINSLTTAQIQTMVYELSDHGGVVTKEHPNGRPLAPKTVRHIGTLCYTALAAASRLGQLKIAHPMADKRVKLPKLGKRNPRCSTKRS